MIEYNCPFCQTQLSIPEQYAGTTGYCKKCNSTIIVPELNKQPVKKNGCVIGCLKLLGYVFLFFIIFGSIGVCIGSQENKSMNTNTPIENIPIKKINFNKFDLVSMIEGDKLLFQLDTDLPGNIFIDVNIYRLFFIETTPKMSDEVSAYYLYKKYTVNELKKINSCLVSDYEFNKKAQNLLDMKASINADHELKGIDETIKIEIRLSSDQDNIIGKNNSNLKGKVINEEMIYIHRDCSFIKPYDFINNVLPKSNIITYENLEIGKLYILDRELIIMPQLEITSINDFHNAVKNIIKIKPYIKFSIIDIEPSGNKNGWLYVSINIFDDKGNYFNIEGFVSPSIFLGSKLRIIEN